VVGDAVGTDREKTDRFSLERTALADNITWSKDVL